MEFVSNSLDETRLVAQKFADTVKSGDIVFLYGDLGASKTTFTGFVLEHLGYKGAVQSPTFVLEQIYNTKKFNAHHIDLYRLEKQDLSLLEFINEINNKDVYFIEWPEVIQDIISPAKVIRIEHLSESSRKIHYEL